MVPNGVVAGGGDLELVDLEVDDIWAKATSSHHVRMLERIGAHLSAEPPGCVAGVRLLLADALPPIAGSGMQGRVVADLDRLVESEITAAEGDEPAAQGRRQVGDE